MMTTGQRAGDPIPFAPICGTDADLSALRSDLEQRRCFRVEQLRQLNTPLHPQALNELDEAHIAVTIDLAVAATVALNDVEDALARIGHDSYGVCEACGTAIPLPRLRELPMTRWCTTCAQAHDVQQSQRAEHAQRALDVVEE